MGRKKNPTTHQITHQPTSHTTPAHHPHKQTACPPSTPPPFPPSAAASPTSTPSPQPFRPPQSRSVPTAARARWGFGRSRQERGRSRQERECHRPSSGGIGACVGWVVMVCWGWGVCGYGECLCVHRLDLIPLPPFPPLSNLSLTPSTTACPSGTLTCCSTPRATPPTNAPSHGYV